MAKTLDVEIKHMAFSPNTVLVNAGDTVRWSNKDAMIHTATADGGEFDSGDLRATSPPFEHTFLGPDRDIPYHCAHHPGMHGTVSVKG